MELKDISYPLRVAYKTKLATLKYNNIAVPVYDAIVPGTAPDYFVVIKDQNEADKSSKEGFTSDIHVTLDIVTRFTVANIGSSTVADTIATSIHNVLCSTDIAKRIDLKPDFNLLNTVRELSKPIVEQTSTQNIFRKIVIYKHTIQQLR